MTETILSSLVADLQKKGLTEAQVRTEFDAFQGLNYSEAQVEQFIRLRHGLPAHSVHTPAKGFEPTNKATIEATIQSRSPSRYTTGPKFYGYLLTLGQSVNYGAFKADFPVNAGDKVRLIDCRIGEYKGKPQVTITESTTIEVLESTGNAVAKDMRVRDIVADESRVNVEGRIFSIREMQREDKSPYWIGTLVDDSGPITFTAWAKKPEVQKGDAVRIENATCKEYKGQPTLNLDDSSQVKKSDKAFTSLDAMPTHAAASLASIQASGRRNNVIVEGLVVDVPKDAGYIYRCPSCSRVLKMGLCQEHGNTKGIPDLRLKFTIDDESGIGYANLGRGEAERILGKTLDQIKADIIEVGDPTLAQRLMAERLIGQHVRVYGNGTTSDFGISILGDRVELTVPDKKHHLAEAAQLLSSMVEVA